MDCIFCKIAAGDIPAHKVYEDDHVLAFLDINPHAKGHTVVIPKKHVETLQELQDGDYKTLFGGVKKTMDRITEVLAPDGYNVGWNHGQAGGQVVPHLHVHVFPRYKGDGGGSMHSIVSNPSDESVEGVAEKFKI